MATQSSASDSMDDPKFQEFLKEPLSNESSIVVEEVKAAEKSRPNYPPTLWWLKGGNIPAVTSVGASGDAIDLTVPQAQLKTQSWLRDRAQANLEPIAGPSMATPQQEKAKEKSPQAISEAASANTSKLASKEPSPGVITSSGATDSMAEFLEKETYFKEESEKERAKRREEDASSDTIVDDEYAEDFTEDISDELYGASQADVKAIMQLLAKQLESVELPELDMPDLALHTGGSGGSSRERSVEEILEEVEEIERSSSSRTPSLEKDPQKITKSQDLIVLSSSSLQASPQSMELPQQSSTPITNDKLLEPELSLKFPSSSKNFESVNEFNIKTATFTIEESLIGPSGDSQMLSIGDRVISELSLAPKNIASETRKDAQLIRFGDVGTSEPSLAVKSVTSETKKEASKTSDSVKLTDTKEEANVKELLLSEQAKCLKLQEALDRKEKEFGKQLENLRMEHEKEAFELKKQSYYLTAKVQDLEKTGSRPEGRGSDQGSELRTQLLETELQKQEQLIVGTQKENEKLFNQVKELKVELASVREGSVSSRSSSHPFAVLPGLEQARTAEQLKDSREKIFKLEIEVKALKAKNKSLDSSLTDVKNKHKSSQEMADKYQRLYKEATSHTVPPQKVIALRSDLEQCRAELKVKCREVTDLSSRLAHAQKQLGETKDEAERWRTEAQGEREKCHSLQDASSALHQAMEDAQEDAKTSADQHQQDRIRIQDLQRQVREMERILRRSQNSVPSVLSGPAPSATPSLLEHLEDRVQQLTEQLTERGSTAKTRVAALESQFTAIKNHYESYISELEQRLANVAERDSDAPRKVARSPAKRAERTDEHLLATVRGLQTELANRDKELQRLARELADSKARRVRLEREALRPVESVLSSDKATSTAPKPDTRKNYESSIHSVTAQLSELQQEVLMLRDQIHKLTSTNQRLTSDLAAAHDSLTSLASQSQQAVSVLKSRHSEEVQRLLVQHAEEMSGSRLSELQLQMASQHALVERLRSELSKSREAVQESEMLRMEKEHLESCVSTLSRQVAELRRAQKPESEQLVSLRVQLEELEARHRVREVRLQAVVREVLRHRGGTSQSAEVATLREALKHKKEQLSEFQGELGRLMTALAALQRARD